MPFKWLAHRPLVRSSLQSLILHGLLGSIIAMKIHRNPQPQGSSSIVVQMVSFDRENKIRGPKVSRTPRYTGTTGTNRNPIEPAQRQINWILTAIEKVVVYPSSSIQKKEEGIVEIQISITPDGTLKDARLVKKSPYPDLDESALRAIQRISELKMGPLERPRMALALVIPVKYQIGP